MCLLSMVMPCTRRIQYIADYVYVSDSTQSNGPLSQTSSMLNIGKRLVRRFPLYLTAHQSLANPRADELTLVPMALRRSPPYTSSER